MGGIFKAEMEMFIRAQEMGRKKNVGQQHGKEGYGSWGGGRGARGVNTK